MIVRELQRLSRKVDLLTEEVRELKKRRTVCDEEDFGDEDEFKCMENDEQLKELDIKLRNDDNECRKMVIYIL